MKINPAGKSGNITTNPGDKDDRVLEQGAPGNETPMPFRLRKILVPVDFSEYSSKALEYALSFAAQFQASLILLHVVEPTVYPENYMVLPPALDEINQAMIKAGQDRLEALRREQVGDRAPAEAVVRVGRAYFEIAEAARALDTDMIIIATHGYTGLKHVLLGSTAERVVRHAPCPVLTVRQAEQEFEKRA